MGHRQKTVLIIALYLVKIVTFSVHVEVIPPSDNEVESEDEVAVNQASSPQQEFLNTISTEHQITNTEFPVQEISDTGSIEQTTPQMGYTSLGSTPG